MIERLTRHLRRWRPILLVVVAALTVILANCGTPSTDTTTSPDAATSPAAEQTALVFGSGGQPVNLEPGNITDGNSIYVQQQIYNRLIDNEPGSTELVPSLATEWTASEDDLTWTFKLREGVKFHDGTDFNAEAVRVNLERWWDPENALGFRDAGKTYEIWTDLFGGFKGDEESLIQAINVVDDSTIEISLKQPFAAFPSAISSGYFGIASPAAIEESGADYGTPSGAAVGTGPFVFQEWRTGDRVILTKNPEYWDTENQPIEDELVIRFITEPSARLAELRAGAIDFTVDLAPDQYQEIEADSNLEVVLRPSFNVGYLALNPAYEPLANKEVRKAIAMAINREEIVKAFWGELGRTDSYFTPESLADFQATDLGNYEYNPEQAKQMLADAGYADGFPLDLWYMPVSRPYFPTPKPIAEAFAADLSAIGIQVSLQTKDWAAYLADRLKPPGFQSFMLGWTGDYGDPDNFFFAHFGPGATNDLGDWKNEEVFQLLAQGREESDPAARQEIYGQVDKILFDETVRIPIVHSQPLLAKRANVAGWVPGPLGSESFETVDKS
ncbi:MAG: ABC transporter substrate-binding protein [Leptolyngbyaceae cyanobacterium SL_7_1]|nr:ABC transporter substrate-binding protein [Leptolyngbyaceae cyanobacterium SL_7_1]